ncbi:hypothetical protein C1646_672522 [Rhizophagus diaphanus]|nr:hypothetical protein C1646_672522 [Rhizophagus diaphanus] [Rhizophagus sp. MUCL 43196]
MDFIILKKAIRIDFHYVAWKINVKKILLQNAFVKFCITEGKKDSNKVYPPKNYLLRYNDLSKLEGLGWIEYTLPIKVHCNRWIQLSIEANKGSIDMAYHIETSIYTRIKEEFLAKLFANDDQENKIRNLEADVMAKERIILDKTEENNIIGKIAANEQSNGIMIGDLENKIRNLEVNVGEN